MKEKVVNLLEDAERTIGILMLEINRLNVELEALKSDTIPYKDLHQVVKNVLAQPMRELTDEEIMDFEWAIKNVFNFSQSEKVVGLDRVIKAILKKASEK